MVKFFVFALFLVVLVLHLDRNAQTKENLVWIKYIISVLLWMIITVMVGARPESVGADTWVYMWRFETEVSQGVGFWEFLSLSKYNPLFNTITWSSFQLNLSSSGYIFIITLLISGLFFVFGRKLFRRSESIIYFVLMLSFPFFYSVTGNVIRAGLAIGCALISFEHFRRGQLKLFLTWATFSLLFHGTGILAFVPLIIEKLKLKTRLLTVLWLSTIFIGHFTSWFSYLPELPMFAYEKAHRYLIAGEENIESTGFRFDFLLFSLIPIILYWFIRQFETDRAEKWKPYLYYLHIYMVLNSVYNLFSTANYSDRFALSSWILIPVLISLYFNNTHQSHRKLLVMLSAVTFFLFYPNRYFYI
ncbi:EpsG family protein [Thalassotalea sp. Y01]|uniref:EpsG family protein n=1 Tax=Thalassotalea sp. Y01 TaxID=2729613 RepID=UPI00145EF4CA|nr:EpsG family protein [Thalassotalea sp. Y01]NMP16515.1 EpsG family protein [Thalassotalea sp. Y01]